MFHMCINFKGFLVDLSRKGKELPFDLFWGFFPRNFSDPTDSSGSHGANLWDLDTAWRMGNFPPLGNRG